MEVAGLAIGIGSLLIGFKGAVDGYNLIANIVTAFEGSSFLIVKLKVENERLRIWGDYYGFNEEEECARLKDVSANAQNLILYILMEMKMTTTDLDKMVKKYGMKMVEVEKDVANDPQLYQSAWPGSDYIKDAANVQAEMNKKGLSTRKSIKWAITDGTKFEKLVDRLEYLNDSLERVLPRSDLAMLALGLSAYILPAQNSSGSLSTLQNSGQQLLASCANMKQIELTRQNIPAAVTSILESDIDQGTRLPISTLVLVTGTWTRPLDSNILDVLVEWQEINRNLVQQTDRDFVYTRVRNLGKILTLPKPSLFCLLPCLGLVEDSEYSKKYVGHKRVGYVFQYPEDTSADTPPVTLQSILQIASTTKNKSTKYAPLGDRFRLAQSLASALLLLHSSKWLHRNLRSSNILLFTPKVAKNTQHHPFYLHTSPDSSFLAPIIRTNRPYKEHNLLRPNQVIQSLLWMLTSIHLLHQEQEGLLALRTFTLWAYYFLKLVSGALYHLMPQRMEKRREIDYCTMFQYCSMAAWAKCMQGLFHDV
jgi:Prion-inhibition and propagation